MSSPFIYVPKKLTQDVDFAPHLRSVISRTYSEQPDAYADELGLLNRSRQDALRGSAGSDVTGRDLLYKYFGQLELLELRFPELRVPFPWNDAFTHVKISQLSLAYEKASVIFNIGATLSSLAACSPRYSPEGLKRAFHSFRCASGMFTYINDNFLHAPSTDLSREVVKALVGLMGAQATEVFIETMGPAAVRGAGLRAKLCMQASSLYAGIIEDVKEWVTKGVFIREWSNLIQTKSKYFASLAQYNRSLADTTALKYGEALARLSLAETLAKESHRLAQVFAGSFSTSSSASSLAPDAPVLLVELTKTHLSLVTDAKNKAQKDNDIVYNEVVPSETSLAPIEKGKDVAEPIPIHDVYASPDVQKIVGPNLFSKLVPLSVHESASLYSEEKAKLVRAEAERADLADGELAAALEYMGLPASLERFRPGAAGQDGLTDPGAQVRGWAEEVRREESQGRVDDLFKKLATLKESAAKQLETASRDLEVESRECESMRVRYGHLWEQQPSSSFTRSYRQDIRSHRESLEQAAASDGQAQGLWEGIRRDVFLLHESSGAALERAFVEAVGTTGQAKEASLLDGDFGEDEEEEIKEHVASISEALSKLSKVKKERNDVLKDLKERVQTDDISHLLILNRKGCASVEPTLFATELEKFRAHQTRVTATLHHQQTTLAEISADFKAVSESKKAREMQGRWAEAERNKKDLVTRLGQAAQTYGEVRLGLQKGIQFYQDLGELVDGLRQQVSSYLQSRDSERTQMASSADIKQRLEGPRVSSPPATTLDRQLGAVDLGPRSPPVLPPQPSSWVPPPQAAFSQPPGQPSYSHPSYAPPPPSVSPYSDFPTSGPFSPSLLPPPKPYGVPPLPPSFASPPTSLSPYGQLQQQQRQSSFPLPSQPVSYGVLPPPSAPVSYGSYALPAPQQSAPYPPQGTYQYSTPPLLPSQPQSSYAGAPQYGQQQATRPYHPNPPAPPRPY